MEMLFHNVFDLWPFTVGVENQWWIKDGAQWTCKLTLGVFSLILIQIVPKILLLLLSATSNPGSAHEIWCISVQAKFIHSFIHYGDLYSASSRLLLRSAPDLCTTKEKSFEARVECVRKNPREQSL